ncbi:MAG: potassium channel protein [Bacteroidota bacterium]
MSPGFVERIAARVAQMDGPKREIFVANLALLLLVIIGTAGYELIEGMSALDGLYMTFITLTTIGFAEVHPLSGAGKVFTIILSIFGIGIVAFVATRSVQVLVLSRHLRHRVMQRKIDRLEGHYVVCGYGRLGRRIAASLAEAGRDLVVIERDLERVAVLEAEGVPHVEGNAEEEATLRAAGIERAQGLVLTLPEDSANVFVTLTAKELRPDVFALARTNEHRNTRKLLRSGVDKVISPYEIGADRMAQVILRPHVDQFMEKVLHVDALDLRMEEVRVGAGSLLDGRSLAESDFRNRFNAVVIAFLNEDANEWRFNPSATATMEAGDILIVLGDHDMIERLRREGGSEARPRRRHAEP